MATVIGANREEFILREMARRAGRKYEPDQPKNPYAELSVEELKAQKALIAEVLKENDEE